MAQKGSLVRGISTEMQDCILSILLFDSEMYDLTKDVISCNFFYGEDYKIIYKSLNEFHKNNKTIPTLKDMMIQISLMVSNSSEISKIKETLKQLYNDYLDEYINKEDSVKKTYFEEFIKRNGAEYCFSTIIEASKNEDGIDWGKVIPKFKKYTDFTITQAKPFLMGNCNDMEKVREDALGNIDSSRKIRFFLDEVTNLMNHRALLPGTLTMVSASPGVGKTLTLVNQGCSAVKDGFTNLHVFLGDLNNYNAALRYLANFSEKPLSEIISMSIEEQIDLMNVINEANETKGVLDRNVVIALPAGALNVQAVCNEIQKIQLLYKMHFDQIIIDYDANILSTNENMYDGGGEIYNYLREFAIKNKSVMLVASQPKVTFFNQEILTLDAASESTKKQHIIDLMLTIGRPGKVSASIGILYVPKNRDGKANKKIHLYIDGKTQKVHVISEDEYERLKREAISNE